MKPFYGHSGSWIDEKHIVTAAKFMKNHSIIGRGFYVNNH